MVTLERARMLTGPLEAAGLAEDQDHATKLTIYPGRVERVGSRPAHLAVVELLHRHGVAGATVLLGVDGTVHGRRERARFFGANARVPLMVIAVGDGARIAAVLPELDELLDKPLATLERVRVLKRDGERLAEPSALGPWQKLMVYAGEQAQHGGRPLYRELVRRLRAEGGMGATSLRGIWGYHGDHEPHGDSFWRLRRRVPVVTVVVDEPDRIQRSFELIDELTAETGLVTSELVPALRLPGAQP
jgi:PII-like signaling protein